MLYYDNIKTNGTIRITIDDKRLLGKVEIFGSKMLKSLYSPQIYSKFIIIDNNINKINVRNEINPQKNITLLD